MARVMDYQTANHFYVWLETNVAAEDQHEVEESVHAALREYPDLIERGMSWREIEGYGQTDAQGVAQ